MFGHADESDDTHPATRSHPGVAVLPAVLAIAEQQGLSGEAVLRAIVLGYDVCARILLALDGYRLARNGFNASARGGLFGAAAACAALLALDATAVRYVLSCCAQQAAGLFTTVRDTQHIEKAYVLGGMPASNGVASALMVASGFTGVDDVFSGTPNFFSAFAPDADDAVLARGLGRDYEILNCAIKYWPAAGGIQGPLHVLRDLMRSHGFRAKDVVKLVVRLPERELPAVDDRDMPGESLQHMLALLLTDGTISFASAHDYRRMRESALVRLRSGRIAAVGDASLNDARRRWRGAIEITLKDGRTLAHQTLAAPGTSENPLSRDDQRDKALDLMAPVLGRRRSEALIASLFSIERVANIRTLRRLYCA
jgi:2-methylcitrate dehydratase PrpD